MSVPPGTEMFQFPGFASTAYVFSCRYPIGVGCPIRISTDQRLLAAPRGFSQRATSFIASWCQGIHRMPFSRSRTFLPAAPAEAGARARTTGPFDPANPPCTGATVTRDGRQETDARIRGRLASPPNTHANTHHQTPTRRSPAQASNSAQHTTPLNAFASATGSHEPIRSHSSASHRTYRSDNRCRRHAQRRTRT
jgi:hypothetical protein